MSDTSWSGGGLPSRIVRITNGPIELNLAIDGPDDAPPVLLLHGITMSTATWDFLVPELRGQRVFRLDFRGHGDSDRADGTYTFGSYVTDAVAAIEQGVGQPCVVVGHSLGGVTAAGLAQQRPDLVKALVLEDPAIFPPPADPGAATAADAMEGNALLALFTMMYEAIPQVQAAGMAVDDLAAVLAAGPSTSGPPAAELYCEDTFDGWARSQLKLDVEVLRPVVDPTSVDAADFVAGGFDLSAPIAVPGVALAGDPAQPDTVLRSDAIDVLAATSPDLRVEIVDGVGHMIHDDRTSRRRFIDTVTKVLADHA